MNDAAVLIQSVLSTYCAGHEETARQLAQHRFPFEIQEPVRRKQIPYELQARLFARDGYRCRYFRDKLLFPGVLLLLEHLMPKEFPADKGYRVAKSHWIYWYVWPVLDHKKAVSSGEKDPNHEANLLTTSTFRNTQKGAWSLQQMEWSDRGQSDSAEDWDGMVEWFRGYMRNAPNDVWEHRNMRTWCEAIGIVPPPRLKTM